jgi:hypothetical protein
MAVLCSWLRCPKLILRSATTKFSGCSSRIYRSCQWNGLSVQRGADRIRMCTIFSQCRQSPVVLNCPKETRDFPRRETIRLDVVPEQQLKWCHSSPRCLLWRQWVLWVDIYRKVVVCVLVWFGLVWFSSRKGMYTILYVTAIASFHVHLKSLFTKDPVTWHHIILKFWSVVR